MSGKQKKNPRKKLGNYRRSKFGPRCLLAQDALLRQYIVAGIPIFHSSVDFFISLSSFSQLSPSPHLYISLLISISIAISIFFSISLHYTKSNNNFFLKRRQTVRSVLLIHGDIAQILYCALLGGNGNTSRLKTTAKLKDKRTSIAMPETYTECTYATFLTPLGSHYGLPFSIYQTSLAYAK